MNTIAQKSFGRSRNWKVGFKSAANYVTLAATILFGGLTAFAPRVSAQSGLPLWTNRYNGPGNAEDRPTASVVDSSGNVFVTGYSATIGSGYDYATLAYSSTGAPLWTNRYNGPANGDDLAVAIALDRDNNVFVTGYSAGSGSGYASYDYATLAYSGAGVPLWTNRYSSPGTNGDIAGAIAADNNGHVFVTGSSALNAFAAVYGTLAYSTAGEPLWTNLGPGSIPVAMAVGSNGNVIVTGVGYATVAYSDTGVALWTNSYKGPGNYDQASAVVVDGSGDVFITGFSDSTATPYSYDYATIKYSSAGVALWTNRYDGPANGEDYASAVSVDGSGKVFVTGYSYGSNGYTSAEYATLAYSSAGVPHWTNRYAGPSHGVNLTSAIAVDSDGNVFVTGLSYGSGGSNDFATLAYSSAGVALWTNRYNGPANNDDNARDIAVDNLGNVFVTGSSAGIGTGYDYATIKYSSSIPPIHLAIERDGSGGFFIRYTGAAGVPYRLQRAASMTGTWTNLATNTAPASGLVEYHDTSPLPRQAFYRTVQP